MQENITTHASLEYVQVQGYPVYQELELTIRDCTSREELRRKLVSKFLDERLGKGKQELTSKYRYNVRPQFI